MCLAIALIGSELPMEVLGHQKLDGNLYHRKGKPEYRFYYRSPRPRLPIIRDGTFQVVRWGNGRAQSRVLPRTGWTWKKSVESGMWAQSGAVPVVIPATYGLERRGVWYAIEVGIRGVLTPDENGIAVCYMVCDEASHYYRNMTGSERMPVLIDQTI